MLHFFGTHYVEMATAVTLVFILVLGSISIMDAIKHKSG